jgi:hypothetical protein
MSTTFTDKVHILAELWVYYSKEADLAEFVDEHELFLFTAFMLEDGIIDWLGLTPKLEELINEAFEMFLNFARVQDEGYKTAEDVLGKAIPE